MASKKPEMTESEPTKRTRRVDVLRVTAPNGPRRRANIAFDKEPVFLREEDLGDTPEAKEKTLELLQGDPMLNIRPDVIEVEITQPEAEPS